MKFLKFDIRKKLCKILVPKDSKLVNKNSLTVDEYIDEHLQKVNQLPEVFTKELLEDLLKSYPKFDHPNILESDGNVKFVDKDGRAVQLKVPLLTIVPIPYISKDEVDLDQYIKDNFGDVKRPKNIEDIQGVEVDVPKLNIVPVPDISKDIEISFNKETKKIKK